MEKLPGFCRGGYSLKVSKGRNPPDFVTMGAMLGADDLPAVVSKIEMLPYPRNRRIPSAGSPAPLLSIGAEDSEYGSAP
jgi:hypothetical protein